jgi:hypothetical protein
MGMFDGGTAALSWRHSGTLHGISETLNNRGEEFGQQRLAEVLRQHVKLPSQALLTSVGVEDAGDADEGEVRTHEVPQDDVPGEYSDKK